jgi:lipid A 3-O-deacylase
MIGRDMRQKLPGLIAGFLGLGVSVPALAGDAPSADTIFSEVRLGVLAHDVHFAGGRENGADINAELLFTSPFAGLGDDLPGWMRWLAEPRPTIGGSVNTDGYTSQGYAGLTWTIPLANALLRPNDELDLGFFFGGEGNNGHVDHPDRDHKALGSNVLFRLGGEIGYQVTPRVGLYVLFDHASNAGFARYNESINDLGARVGLRF